MLTFICGRIVTRTTSTITRIRFSVEKTYFFSKIFCPITLPLRVICNVVNLCSAMLFLVCQENVYFHFRIEIRRISNIVYKAGSSD